MRHLTIFRHAKSSWSSSAKNDFARPLAPRGIKAALRMGHWLSENDLLPDRILCSTAKRARETRKLAAKLWTHAPQLVRDDSLYMATPDDVMTAVTQHGGDAKRLMVIGHNPGLQELVLKLDGQKGRVVRDIIGKFPTGAVADLAYDIENWSDIGKNCATLTTFMRPRALR